MGRKPKPKKYLISFEIDLGYCDVRPAQIERWIRYQCGDKGRLRRDNPLHGLTLDPIYGTFKVEEAK